MSGPGKVDILLVEDNDDHGRFILTALKEDNGIETYWMKDGKEALDFLRARHEQSLVEGTSRPLVVLLDIHLPKVGGLDVLRAIRRDEALQMLPVVMLTTSARKEEIAAAYRAGANGYVTKPVKFGEFVDKIKSLKHYWTFTSEVPAA
jgi:two-component system response regulator